LASLNLAIMLNADFPFLYKNYRVFHNHIYLTGSGDAIYSYDFDGQTINYATSQLHYKICETFDEFDDGVIDTTLWDVGAWPTAYWKFNESSGNATDSSGNNHTLTNYGGITYTAGKLNNCASFSGNGNSKYFYNSDTNICNFGTDKFTIAFWIKEPNSTTTKVVMVTDDNWLGSSHFGISEYNHKIAFASDINISSSTTIDDNNWHRVVMVREGTGTNQFKIYVDGVLDTTGTVTRNFDNGSGTWIGGGNRGVTSGIQGLLDDVRIYKGIAWTASDVATDWSNGNGCEELETIDGGGYVQLGAAAYLAGKPTKTVLSSSVKYFSFSCYFNVGTGRVYLTDGSNNVLLFSGGPSSNNVTFDCFYEPGENKVYVYKDKQYYSTADVSILSEMRLKLYALRCYWVRKQKPSPSSTITQYISSDNGTTYTSMNDGYETTISNPGTQVKYKLSYNVPSGEYIHILGGGIFART